MSPSPQRKTSSRINVRRARRADLDALIELEHRLFATDRMSRASLRRMLTVPTARVLVAEIGSRFAGTAVVLFRRRSKVARLYSIAVSPPMSGQGVGPALLAAVEAVARARRCRCVRLEVHVDNAAAISRYRKSGYRPFGRYSAYYEDAGDALRFEKPVVGAPARLSQA